MEVIVPEETVRYYLNNLGLFLDSALAAPRFGTDAAGRSSIKGFEISRIRKGGIIESLGFKDGDVILAVNNQPLVSLPAALNTAVEIQGLQHVEILVLRDGKTLRFVFERE
jgi:C-terminal processing protease CtpA/Prc